MRRSSRQPRRTTDSVPASGLAASQQEPCFCLPLVPALAALGSQSAASFDEPVLVLGCDGA